MLPSAEDARSKSQLMKSKLIQEELKEIENAIIKAINQGDTSCTIPHEVNPLNLTILKDNKYSIVTLPAPIRIIIKW